MLESPLFPNLCKRAHSPEMMDRTDSDPQMLRNTLDQFAFLNRTFTRSRHLLKKHVVARMNISPERQYHLVDLGAGACDTAVWLLQHCRNRGLQLRITACDRDPRAVHYAQEHCGSVAGLAIKQRDIMKLDELDEVDFFFGNHILHHLSDSQIVELLQKLADFQRSVVVFEDLKRSRLAYSMFHLFSRLFLRNSFAHCDGLLSIRKGFRRSEIAALICAATPTLEDQYTIRRWFPNRISIVRGSQKEGQE